MLMLGFLFDSWSEIHQHLTGEDLPGDSGAVEKYAKALGLEAVFLDEIVFLGVSLENDEEFASGVYSSVGIDNLTPLKALGEEIKEKLEATGVEPEGTACVFAVSYEV